MTMKEKVLKGLTSLNDLFDSWFGKLGTPERKQFEDECEADLKSLRYWQKMKRLAPNVKFYAEHHGGYIYKDHLTYKQL